MSLKTKTFPCTVQNSSPTFVPRHFSPIKSLFLGCFKMQWMFFHYFRASNNKWVLNTFRLTFRNLNLIWEVIGKYSVTGSIKIWQPNFGYFQYWLVKIYDIDNNNSPPAFFMIGWIGCCGCCIFQLLPKLNSNF